MAVEFVRHRFSVEQYERMVETGVLTEDDRLELIRGEIVEKMPISPEHSTGVYALARALTIAGGEDVVVRTENPIRLPPDSEPEPDIVVARGPFTRYAKTHPQPGDVLLVVEVAHSSADRDRIAKMSLYAENGIPEAWLLDLPMERLEVYREPRDGVYASVTVVDRGGRIAPLPFPDLTIRLDDVLPSTTS